MVVWFPKHPVLDLPIRTLSAVDGPGEGEKTVRTEVEALALMAIVRNVKL